MSEELESIKSRTSVFEEVLHEIKEQISDLRKQGKDPLLPSLIIKSIPSKISWVKHSKNDEDCKKIEALLDEALKELEEESKQNIVDVKAQVEEMVAGTESEKVKEQKEEQKKDLEKKTKENHVRYFEKLKMEVRPGKYFFLHNGDYIKSIDNLINKLPVLSDEDFEFHVRYEENDFSKWIADVFKEYNLSKKIKGVHDKHKMLTIIKDYLRGEE